MRRLKRRHKIKLTKPRTVKKKSQIRAGGRYEMTPFSWILIRGRKAKKPERRLAYHNDFGQGKLE